jgi:hypothetical protein
MGSELHPNNRSLAINFIHSLKQRAKPIGRSDEPGKSSGVLQFPSFHYVLDNFKVFWATENIRSLNHSLNFSPAQVRVLVFKSPGVVSPFVSEDRYPIGRHKFDVDGLLVLLLGLSR